MTPLFRNSVNAVLLSVAALSAQPCMIAQSTQGTIIGTVQDSSGAAVAHATVVLHRLESNATRTVITNDTGAYTALNVDPGHYDVTVQVVGLKTVTALNLSLGARQQLRYDVTLQVGDAHDSVTVNAADAGTINTETAQISAALSPRDVLDLPANYRGNGSTSPINVVQTLPGVQPDSGAYPPSASSSPSPQIKFSIQGGLPSQSETTVDGISAQNQTTNEIQGDAFPSAESIAEVRVDGVNNNAEYGQPGEITTVTKSGTNTLHGALFEYHQNRAFDAVPYGTNAANKPQKVANDFGGSIGGPVVLPHLYNGRDKLFFFATYEGLRFPQATVLQAKVPTVAMKQGDFSQETPVLNNPFNGGTYPGQRVPINPSSQAFLQFYPDPNVGANLSFQNAITQYGYNYLSTRRNDIGSNQFDARVDKPLGQRGSAFARYTWKNINQVQRADLDLPNYDAIGQYRIFAASVSYALTTKLVNEFRFGFTLEQDGNTNSYNGAAFTASTGLQGLNLPAFFNGIPHLGFDQIQSIGSRLGGTQQSRIFQYVDNLNWQIGNHSVKLGADVRQLNAHTILGFTTSDNYGNLFFTPNNSATGQEFADFLIGVPYQTQVDNVSQDNEGKASAYAFYAQDNWKVTPSLTFTYGVRYEFHPAFSDPGGNIGNFDPSVPNSGRLIYPSGAVSHLAPEELGNLNACVTPGVNNPYATNAAVNGAPCTPVLSNTQAGVPAGLRHAPTLRFEPRFGFNLLPFGNDHTAIRGGIGYYNITTSGALFYALTGTLQANVQTFNNTSGPGGPAIVFPNISTASTNSFAGGNFSPGYGSTGFYNAVDINWHDPYSLQTNLSVDHDFGHHYSARVSYVGMHTWHLVWQPEYNMLQTSSTVRATDQPRSAFPFPNFYQIGSRDTAAQADYRSLQAEVSHRLASGFSFDSAYTYAKNLSDDQGTYGAANANNTNTFVDEQGGYNGTYTYDRHLDYGNVIGTRRHRSITTAIYELPVGRGRQFGAHLNKAADLVVGGWQLSNIFLAQTGPFLTAYLPSGTIDPSGTGSGTLFFRQQRPDRFANGNSTKHDRNQWFNNNAFACPGSAGYASLAPVNGVTPCTVGVGTLPIGRFGTESTGDLVGPGTISLSTGLSKAFALTDHVNMRAEGTFTNVLNHTNLADPQLDITQANFGQITQARGSDFGGNRTGQVSLRLEF